MNRAARRAEEARTRAAAQRHAAVRQALAYMAASDDPTLSGCTVLTPNGETVYLDIATARAMKPDRGGR